MGPDNGSERSCGGGTASVVPGKPGWRACGFGRWSGLEERSDREGRGDVRCGARGAGVRRGRVEWARRDGFAWWLGVVVGRGGWARRLRVAGLCGGGGGV